MRTRTPALAAVILIFAASTLAIAGDAVRTEGSFWAKKVDPWVLEQTREGGSTEFIVYLDEQADLSRAASLETKLEKGTYVYQTLSALAETSQKPVLQALEAEGVEHRSYWVANMIWVKGDHGTVQAMAERRDVGHIYANPWVAMDGPVGDSQPADEHSPEAVEWNIALVNADDAWMAGYDGSGTVIGGQDTGYDWDHPALVNQYRGSAGNHDYYWHDAIHSGGGSCGADSTEPCDDYGHGTHTMGTMVGDDGGSNQVGMAPGAAWIGCRNMDQGVGTPATYSECYEWFIAPTDLNDANPDPAMAPDVINNSWGCPVSEGCTDPDMLLTVVQAVRAAGIVTVHSAGNDGWMGCSSVSEPSAIYGESFSVGATTSSDNIASFSSRGPVTIDGSNRMKPDISAPGVDIRSCSPGGGYVSNQGTSMAGPHVAGMVSLVIDSHPGLGGDVDQIEEIIELTAVPLTTTEGCGGDSSTDVPNNVFGWGRIDALAAANYSLDYLLSADPTMLDLCIPDAMDSTITVSQFQGFSEPVTLSTSSLPSGTTASFTPNPATPGATSLMTLSSAAGATTGGFAVTVTGTSDPSNIVHHAELSLELFDQAPAAPSLTSPYNGEVDVLPVPTFTWSAVAQAGTYLIEVATDAAFTDVIVSDATSEASHTIGIALTPLNTYYWRVQASNPCGDGPLSSVFSFTTADIPPILLVDDDDNDPDVLSYYTDALDNLGLAYDTWDTGNSDSNEPDATDLAAYRIVIWFSGDEWLNGTAGPGAATETELETWLDTGACMLISAQDWYYNKGLTTFMANRMGVADASSDVAQTTVTGAGSVFGGTGPYTLNYPVSNYSDEVDPDATAETAFTGNSGNAAVNKDGGVYKTVFMGFPLEAMDLPAREENLLLFVDWCQPAAAVSGQVFSSPVLPDMGSTIVEAYQAGTTNQVAATVTDSGGVYSLQLGPDVYDIVIGRPMFLWGLYTQTLLAGDDISLPDLTLVGGDFDSSDDVGLVDVTYVSSRFGTGDLSADLNGSGDVDLVDVTATASAYGQTAPVPWP